MDYQCEYCNDPFVPKRADSRYCSHSCRQLAYILRKATINGKLQGLQAVEMDDEPEKKERSSGDFLVYPSTNEYPSIKKQLSVRTDIENSNAPKNVKTAKPKVELEYEDYDGSFLTDLDYLYHERDTGIKLDKFFDSKDAAAIWVSETYRCLLECLLLFSEMKQVELDDLKEVCNTFTSLIQCRYFKCLHVSYPYIKEIRQLKEQIKNICIKAGENMFVKYRPNIEQRKKLIVARFELSEFVPKKKFSELNFKDK